MASTLTGGTSKKMEPLRINRAPSGYLQCHQGSKNRAGSQADETPHSIYRTGMARGHSPPIRTGLFRKRLVSRDPPWRSILQSPARIMRSDMGISLLKRFWKRLDIYMSFGCQGKNDSYKSEIWNKMVKASVLKTGFLASNSFVPTFVFCRESQRIKLLHQTSKEIDWIVKALFDNQCATIGWLQNLFRIRPLRRRAYKSPWFYLWFSAYFLAVALGRPILRFLNK